jgi:sigma-B regulation protein RsbU (phosphoserine phosphatase)
MIGRNEEVSMEKIVNQEIKKGIFETGENLKLWLKSTPEAKQEVCCGPEDETCVEEHLRVIDESLEKIDDGTFGICEICSEQVDDELLKMDYTATVCLGHYTEQELRQLEAELELSQIVQRSLLPQQAPEIPGMNIAGFSRPAQIVSGDYYDFFQFKDGTHGIVMADVSGHGVSAGMLMTSLQTAFHTLVPDADSPLDVLERINRLYVHNVNFTTFVTIFFAKFDPKTRIFTYANAGHNSAYLYRTAKKEETWLRPTGPAIGLMEGFNVRAEQVELKDEDILLIYTDGITEAMNSRGEQFGTERLAKLVREHTDLTAQELANNVLLTVSDFADGKNFVDDITIITSKIG